MQVVEAELMEALHVFDMVDYAGMGKAHSGGSSHGCRVLGYGSRALRACRGAVPCCYKCLTSSKTATCHSMPHSSMQHPCM